MRAISSPDCAPLMPISGRSRPSWARVRASQWQVSGRFQNPPTPSVVSDHRRKGLDIRDQSEQTAGHHHGVGARLERRAGELGHPLALAGELHPERDFDCSPHRRDDRPHPRRIELGRDHAPRLARIGGADIELEHAHAGLLDPAGHLDGRLELRQDQARNRIGIAGFRFPVECQRLLEPGVERLRRKPRAACDRHRRRRLPPPRHLPPALVQHHVLGALQLILRRR